MDRVVYRTEHICADYVLMILSPSSNDGIKHQDQPPGRERLVLLNDVPDLFQVGMHILLRWFDQQFVPLSCFVFPYILTQEAGWLTNLRHLGKQ